MGFKLDTARQRKPRSEAGPSRPQGCFPCMSKGDWTPANVAIRGLVPAGRATTLEG
jgi:hypothetical protein